MLGRRVKAGRALANDAELRILKQIADAVDARNGYGDLDVLELPVVSACRDLIANTVAQCPQYAYTNGLPRPNQPPILARPNPSEMRYVTMTRLVNNLTGRHGYVWLRPIARYGDGYPAAVQVIDASDAHGTFDPTGRTLTDVYYCGDRYEPGPDGILHVPWKVPDRPGALGASPLGECDRAVQYLAALWEMAGSFWEAGFPSIAYVVEQALNKVTRDEVKASMVESFRRRHEPTVVDRGGQFQPLGGSAVESQLVETIAVANVEIARAYGVMPSLVNVMASDALTYATSAAELAKWFKLGLGAYLSRVDAAFGEFTPHGTVVRSDATALLRADLEQRVAFYDAGIRGGWLDPLTDVRPAEGLAPLDAPRANRPTSLLADPIGANQ